MDTRECDKERRRIQGQPSTKDITQKKNHPRAEHALTRRVAKFQEAKTPSREEFGIYRLTDVPAAQPVAAARAPPTMPNALSSPSKSVPTMFPARRGPARKHQAYRWWSRGAHESEIWEPDTHTRKCRPAATAHNSANHPFSLHSRAPAPDL